MQIVLLRGGMRGGLYLYLYIDLQLESSVTVASGTSPATRLCPSARLPWPVQALQLQAEATGCTVSCTVFAPSAWVSALPPTLSLGRAIDTDWTLFYLYLSTSTSVSETGGSTHFSAPTAHASDLGVIGPFHGSGLDKGGSVAHPPVSPAT